MTMLEPAFKKATAIPKGGSRALAKVQSGQYDAALFVITPGKNTWLFNTVNKSDDLQFADITDWDLNDKYNGKPIYKFRRVTTKPGFFGGDKVKTICTEAAVFINDQVDDDTADALSDAILNRKNYILKGAQ